MPAPGFVQRLREQGGPSFEILVLLDQHRVLTTDQLARASGTPLSTIKYRLARLLEHDLVAAHRPGREVGSAPRHWWLRPAGARLVTGATPPASGRPSHPFVAHAAAISEVWLAVTEHGPAAGVTLLDWATDRAGWQEWEPPSLYGGTRRRRLTPDAVLRARVEHDGPAGPVAGETAAFVEVDLSTMPQTQLRERVERYATYARERAWEGVHPHLPALLVLTTTTARAVNFARTARRVLGADDRRGGYLPRGDAERQLQAVDELVVAVCGLVRDPGRAITEPVWLLPEQAAAELTLAELLAERVDLHARAAVRRADLAVAQLARARLDALGEVRQQTGPDLAALLGDRDAADVLLVLAEDPAAFLDHAQPLAEQVLAWWGVTTTLRVRHPAGDETQRARLVDALRARHHAIWARHVRLLLDARVHHDADDPRTAALAAQLQDGQLLGRGDRAYLRTPPASRRREDQADALEQYRRQRDADVDAEHAALSWRARRRTTREDLAAGHDAQLLLVCTVCGIVLPRPDPDPARHAWDGTDDGELCPYCHTGTLTDPAGQHVPSLTERLTALRDQLGDTTASPETPA